MSYTDDTADVVRLPRPAVPEAPRPDEHGSVEESDGPEPEAPPSEAPPGRWQPQTLIVAPPPVPAAGWRRVLHRATLRRLNPGPSPQEAERAGLRAAVAAPPAARTGERIAILSTKGGVGKTTTTVMVGHTLATERGDRVVALDANPDYGTLGYRVSTDTPRTVRDLLAAAAAVHSYPDVRAFTSQAASRLEVISGDADPAVSDAFTAADYATATRILGQHYNVVLTDCGTGVLHDAMGAVLHLATQLVVVTGPAVDQARHADHLLRWLRSHARPDLVDGAVVIVNASRNDLAVDLDSLFAHFAALAREVVEIPYDPVLAAGGLDGLDELAPVTRDAYLRAARAVVRHFDLPAPVAAAPPGHTVEQTGAPPVGPELGPAPLPLRGGPDATHASTTTPGGTRP